MKVFFIVFISFTTILAGAGNDPSPNADTGDGTQKAAQPSPTNQDALTGLQWIDGVHNWIYDTAHGGTVWFDRQFVPQGKEPLKVPPSRFRLGLFTELSIGGDEDFELQPVVDFDTDINLPNLERRLRLFVTTKDPSALPGETPTESNNDIRVGAAREFLKNWDTSVGVKAKWPPEAFANVQWAPTYKAGDHWTFYPKGKLFWDNEDKIGFLTALITDYWVDRWLFRQSVSGKWNKAQADEDSDDAGNPDSFLFGEDGKGYRWAVAYVPRLLNEQKYGRRISGGDVADGWGLRGRVRGDAVQTLSYELTVMRKGPLYKDFVYYVIAPQVTWEKKFDWEAEYTIEIGVEMLIWGDDPLR